MIETLAAAAAPPRLQFEIEDLDALTPAATPTLRIRLRISTGGGRAVSGIGLSVRVRIAAQRRRYDPLERRRLRELFGPENDWARSLGALPWTQTTLNIGPFEAHTSAELALPCTYDFEVVAAKYLAALADGEVPIELLFSGMLFYPDQDGRLQTAMIPWEHEASTRMPVSVWRAAVDSAFPDSAWLLVRRDVFARLQSHRSCAGFTTWEETLGSLLELAGA